MLDVDIISGNDGYANCKSLVFEKILEQLLQTFESIGHSGCHRNDFSLCINM